MKKIDMIQLLRFLGAINIFIYHSGIVGDYGYYGVEIFSIISGYILMYSTQNEHSVKFFFRKRLIRILPLYWCLTVVMFLAVYKVPSISIMSEAKMEYLVKSLLFIPFVNSKGYNVPIVGAGWTLNYEMLFYCIFFIAVHVSFKYRGILSVSMIMVLVLIGHFIDFQNYFMNYYTNYFMLEFALGIVAFYVVERLRKMNSKTLYAQYCFVLGVSLMLMILDVGSSARWIRLGIPACLFCIAAILLNDKISITRIIVQLGDLSFSFYLIEYFTTGFFKYITNDMMFVFKIMTGIIIMVITFGVSYVSYCLFEKKLTGYLKERFCT